ncbi:MAG: SDR family oxidoreductase [Pseudomonadales bacterium]
MSNSLNDKVAFVTAGAAGIGRAIAETFLQQGCKVHVCDVNNDTLQAFLADNPRASGSICDVSKPEQVAKAYADIQSRYSQLNILVNNAGIAGPTAPVAETSIEDWDQTVAVDLNGQFYCTRLAVPMLQQAGGGSVINISSSAAFFGFPLRSPYSACKWAMIGFTKTLAMEVGVDKIRVNAICPGSVEGPRIEGVIERDAQERGCEADEIRDIYQRQTSLRTFVKAQDIANMALYLASDAGSVISGQVIGVDGHTEGLSNWLS